MVYGKVAFQSPFLFAIYVNDLIDKLRQSGFGLYVGSLFVGCICTRTTLHCFLVVVMDSRNLLIYAMIMESNMHLNRRRQAISDECRHCGLRPRRGFTVRRNSEH